ncbi:AraC family transcriptional regulator ligand-binding domain-containing protein [Solimonas marina]|uniref:Helix-turn-helix domain-containing protein n=1 Tax=Solimonas marina TaxID=2714601 RepID=A0A969W945_9GAMM|nr:AraC family transcriptional regulator ligand-binding domain-containing protein [Solimonas marina]NKF23006.1 helix-turn-helix domain-containing protein [Solimonas marina]
MHYLVRSGSLAGFADLVSTLGADPLAILDAVGIEAAALHDADVYLPYPALARCLTHAAQACRRDDFGVRLAQRQGLDVTGALGTQLCLQPSMTRALEMMQRHLDFHARGIELTATPARGSIVMSISFAFAHQVDCAQLTALSMGLLVRSLTQLHGEPLPPQRVELRQPAPRAAAQYRQLFGAQLEYNAPADRVHYPTALTDLPIRVDACLREQLSANWRLGHGDAGMLSLAQQVERAIVALLPVGDCGLDNVARMVDLHPRVLQSRLRAEGLSFGAILRRARERLAREHLSRSDTRLTQLAMQLGYGDLAVFSRSFRKWTGHSPRSWRRLHAN